MDKHPVRTLTNFSIDSIIGSSNGHKEHQKKIRPKNYQCPVCRMAFSNNGQLKNHVRIHTGERPFKCNISSCGKAFTRNEELTRHKLIHTGARPHSCPKCSKSFGRKDHLKKHVKTHDKKKLRRSYFAAPEERSTRRRHQTEANHAPMEAEKGKPEKDSPDTVSLTTFANMSGLISSLTQSAHTQFGNQLNMSKTFLPMPSPQSTYIPPVTFTLAQPSSMVTTIARSTPLNMFAPPAVADATLNQLTNDYWRKWYDFLSHCQRP